MRELTDNVYRLDNSRGANGYVVARTSGCVLIDPGLESGAGAVLRELTAEQDRVGPVLAILLTHYDIDHCGAAATIQRESGVQIWLGAADIPILERTEKATTRVRRLMTAVLPARIPEQINAITADSEVVPGIRAIPAPGHTPGHTMFEYRGVLFSGDAVTVKAGRLSQFAGFLITDKAQAIETEQLVRSRAPRLICPGHGAPDRLAPA